MFSIFNKEFEDEYKRCVLWELGQQPWISASSLNLLILLILCLRFFHFNKELEDEYKKQTLGISMQYLYLTYIYFTWDMEMLVVRNQMQQPQISASSLNLLILFLNFCLHLTKNYNYNYVFWELGQESNAATTNIFASSLTWIYQNHLSAV